MGSRGGGGGVAGGGGGSMGIIIMIMGIIIIMANIVGGVGVGRGGSVLWCRCRRLRLLW
jgi:hypothetical protein